MVVGWLAEVTDPSYQEKHICSTFVCSSKFTFQQHAWHTILQRRVPRSKGRARLGCGLVERTYKLQQAIK